MSVQKKKFGFLEDQEVFEYTLDNNKGLCVKVLTYGGIIKNIITDDRNGQKTDVVLGRDTLEEYLSNDGYLGAAIGRNGNRIEDARFELNGKEYILAKNNKKNNLHGGMCGFNSKVWSASSVGTEDEPAVSMSLFSPDGEEGFPGNLTVTITYTVTSDNTLKINYRAMSDSDTVVNLTNHSYFNLSGHSSGVVYDQVLQMNSSFYTPNNEGCAPNGEILSVTGTPMDFRVPKPVGQDINADYEQLRMFGGYDHNFIIDGCGYRIGAVVKSTKTGIVMTMKTDCPGVQLYSGNCLAGNRACKDGVVYKMHNALCLETQAFPNAMRYKHFPSTVLKAGDVYDTTTEYKFTIER